jgi:HlyD family secretion protein
LEDLHDHLGQGRACHKEDETVDVVYIVEGGKAQPVRVTTGLTDESHVEILAGLKEGQSVITGPYRSLRKLKAGDKVTEKKEEELKVEESEEKKAEE